MASSWLIGKYTGDPYRDVMITYSCAGSFTAASLCTVAVDGAVLGHSAMGSVVSDAVCCTADATLHAGGTCVFLGSAQAGCLFSYIIVHKPKR
jgi:hypothetical protein